MKWRTSVAFLSPVVAVEDLQRMLERAEGDLIRRLEADRRLGGAVRISRLDPSTSHSLDVQSPWINGELRFTSSHLQVDAELSLLAWPFRKQIEEMLKSWIEECQTP